MEKRLELVAYFLSSSRREIREGLERIPGASVKGRGKERG